MSKFIFNFQLVSAPSTDPIAEAVRALLCHSWQEINFEYDGLTPQEKACITRAQHGKLVAWVRGADITKARDIALRSRMKAAVPSSLHHAKRGRS